MAVVPATENEMMPMPLDRDLTGKNIRSWFVVSYAGQRGGVSYWKCMCRESLAEKIIPEREILDRKVNALSSMISRWREAWNNPNGWIYGEWTVMGLAGQQVLDQSGKTEQLWKCRCICGTERVIPRSALAAIQPRTFSCGCRPETEVWAELQQKRHQALKGLDRARGASARRSRQQQFDKKWTRAMEHALCSLQPACVLCDATDDLTKHHVRPLSEGYGLEPGNVVRLCRVCNSSIYTRGLSELTPSQARKLELAAAQFKELWQNGCVNPAPFTPVAAHQTPEVPDDTLISLLRAVECSDDTAIPALANWLEEHGDPRATAIRELTGLEAVPVTPTNQDHATLVQFVLDGKVCGPWAVLPRSSGGTEESLAQNVRACLIRERSNQVWTRLGLSFAERSTLKLHLGITASGRPATADEIAKLFGKKPQAIRIRIELALHRLSVPSRPQVVK